VPITPPAVLCGVTCSDDRTRLANRLSSAAFAAPAPEHLPACSRAHSLPKPVGPAPTNSARLICAFHDNTPGSVPVYRCILGVWRIKVKIFLPRPILPLTSVHPLSYHTTPRLNQDRTTFCYSTSMERVDSREYWPLTAADALQAARSSGVFWGGRANVPVHSAV